MNPSPEAALPFRSAGPEATFHVGTVRRTGAEFETTMRTGPWNRTPQGGSCAGALGVLVDDVLGSAVLVERPAASWSVSTEITIDLVSAPPFDGTELRCTGRAVLAGRDGGLARGEVLDEHGRLVAIATQRQRFVPGEPARPDVTDVPGGEGRDALECIGGVLRSGQALELTGSPALANPGGNVHGGIALCASELAASAAHDAGVGALTTTSVHIAYLRPMPISGVTTFAAEIVHRGRTFGVARVTAYSAAGRACTVATVAAQTTLG